MNIRVIEGYVNNPGDLTWEPLEEFGTVTIFDRTAPDELATRVADADIVVSSKTVWDEASLALAPHLKMIALTSTGYNVVDLETARNRGIVVSNVPAYSTPDVAQMTFALLLELCAHVGDHARGVAQGKWIACDDFCYWDRPLIELSGKTFGIVGMGSIGSAVARIAGAFGMDVVFCNRSPKPEAEHMRCAQLSFNDVLAQSDIVSLHCPATPETEQIINAEAITNMKDGAILINTARGTLVDEEALAEALNSGRLSGAGVDVLSAEPMRKGNPLQGAKNVIITPHIAWATFEARTRLLNAVFENVRAFCAGKPRNVVN